MSTTIALTLMMPQNAPRGVSAKIMPTVTLPASATLMIGALCGTQIESIASPWKFLLKRVAPWMHPQDSILAVKAVGMMHP
jgi:hypothetical protein